MNCQCGYRGGCVKTVPIFQNLKEENLERLSHYIEQKNFKKGEILFHEGDPVDRIIIFRQGRIKLLRYDEEGKEYLMDILSPGDIYGGNELFGKSKHQERGVALDDLGICTIAAKDLKLEIQVSPEIAFAMMDYLNIKMLEYRNILEIIGTKDALKRTILFLLERQKKVGSTILMSQEEIGNAIHLTKETVNRKLSEMERMGYIQRLGNKKIKIVDEFSMQTYQS